MNDRYGAQQDSLHQQAQERKAAIAKLKAKQPETPAGHLIAVRHNPGGGAVAFYAPEPPKGRRYGRKQ